MESASSYSVEVQNVRERAIIRISSPGSTLTRQNNLKGKFAKLEGLLDTP